jgi:sarcosine oxidase
MADVPDVAVVGGGLLGLSAARALGRRGKDVALFEQSSIGNERSGSKGTARIFRFGYDDPFYVQLSQASLPMWRDLEAETGRSLLEITGQLSFGDDVVALASAMATVGAPFEPLDLDEARTRYPVLNLHGDVIYEPESGVLAADRCLAALKQSALSFGVRIRENTSVTSVSEGPDDVLLELRDESGSCAGESISVPVVVICAGPWTNSLLNSVGINLRLVTTLEQVAFLAPSSGHDAEVPVFIERASPKVPWVYGLPAGRPGLLKVALHHAGPVADPNGSRLEPDPKMLAALSEQYERLLPFHHCVPTDTERCFYDTTPDEDFVIDRVGRVGRVVVGAGTSGHGFKFGPLLGEFLADLAVGSSSAFDLTRFSARRAAVRADR